jgi:protein-S-isoprenylcysteine O-methyltransferase Ste14
VMAYRNMGKMFTYDLGLRKGHALVTSGIHGVVRHPGYVGTLLMHMGLGLISTSWLAMLLTVGSIAIVLQIRVRREETLLKTQFGSIWEAYAQQTGRWIPQV